MKKAKWICRYIFFTLLLVGAVLFTLYSHSIVLQIEEVLNSTEFIDKALRSYSEAAEVIERCEYYMDLRFYGFIVSAVILGITVLLILWNIFGDKLVRKLKSLFTKKKKNKKKDDTTPVQQPSAEAVKEQKAPAASADNAPVQTEEKVPTVEEAKTEESAQTEEKAPTFEEAKSEEPAQTEEKVPTFEESKSEEPVQAEEKAEMDPESEIADVTAE